MTKKTLTYSASGVNYQALDPVKKMAQAAAKTTAIHMRNAGASEVAESRGESAYVWRQGSVYMASVIEGLGTKNLVADAMRPITKKTYYDVVAHDTVATIINDLVTVGAKPLAIHAYWGVGQSAWLEDKERMKDLINGWKKACDIAGVSWGGGETPASQGIIHEATIDLAGSAVGIIPKEKYLITEKNLRDGDRIILMKSNGINANGLSLARAIAKGLPKGYATPLPGGKLYGEALLTRSNIYAGLVQALFSGNISIHYIANITGHGLRKIMRAKRPFTYIIESLFAPQPVFSFMQAEARLSDYEMYETFNMGQDYAIIVPARQVDKALAIMKKNGFQAIDAGYIETGPKQVILEPKKIVFEGKTLNVR